MPHLSHHGIGGGFLGIGAAAVSCERRALRIAVQPIWVDVHIEIAADDCGLVGGVSDQVRPDRVKSEVDVLLSIEFGCFGR